MNIEKINKELERITGNKRWEFKDKGGYWKLTFNNLGSYSYCGCTEICGSVYDIADLYPDGTLNIWVKLDDSGNTAEQLAYKYIPRIKEILEDVIE